MRLRPYTSADIEAMYQLDLACFTTPYQFDREMMQQVAEAANAIVVLVEEDGMLLGFVIAHVQGKAKRRHAYIVTIDVAPAARHHGIGAKLLQQAEAQAAAAGVHWIGLHAAVDNEAAIAFYGHQGYQPIGIEPNFYREAGTDAVVYLKPL